MEKSHNVKNEVSGDIFLSPSPTPPNCEMPSLTSESDLGTTMPSCSNSNANNNETDNDVSSVKDDSSSKQEPIDIKSVRKIFGWETLDGTSIPYLLRRGKKYVSIRIVERKLLSKYPNASPDELGKKDPLVSHFITEAEANLLNEINTLHCDYEYGENSFNERDLVVDLEEFEEFFKVVKKTFPEEILASMNLKGGNTISPHPTLTPLTPTPPTPTPPTPTPPTPTPPVPTPPTVEPSQICGWIQINNTVSPYIIRGAGKEQVKLVPLSVIVYAAGLLTNANVEGLNPTSHECRMLNAACKTAGFDFTFGRNTRLIAISEVVQRCQVHIFELPLSNPLQHAHYLDHRMAPPMSSVINPALRQAPPPYPCRGVPMTTSMTVDTMGGRPPGPGFINPFVPRMPGHDFSHPPRIGVMMPPGMNFDNRPIAPDQKLSNLDPSQFPASIQQALLDKCHRLDNAAVINTMNKMPSNSRPPFWSMMPVQPPPAHSGKLGTTSKTPPSPFDTSLPSSSASSTSSYQPLSLPPNPLLHPNSLDINHPIYRMPGLTSPSCKDNHPHDSGISKQGPPLSSQHQQGSHHSLFGNNQFNSSLFARSDSVESKKSGNQPSQSVITSTNHQMVSQSTNKPQPTKPSQRSNTNNYTLNLVKSISACLVNGKSISCLDVDATSRKGKYCLVEAVSKLYFPSVPIQEFVKVLKVVLKANLYPCTPEEEAAFVQYYNLPAPRLKCNQMILVDDLTRNFPRLNYVFSKRNANHVLSEEANGGLKRAMESAASGPPMKQATLDSMGMGHKVNTDRKPMLGEIAGTSNGGGTASVIVIDD